MTPLEWTLVFFGLMFVLSRIRIRVVEEKHVYGKELVDAVTEKPPVICTSEIINDQIYIWNKETKQFLVQGKTMDDIVEFFSQNYPGRKIILSENTQS